MYFGLTEEQEMIVKTVRSFVENEIYPHENLFSHVIGQIDDNNNGVSGIEKSFDNELKNKQFQ